MVVRKCREYATLTGFGLTWTLISRHGFIYSQPRDRKWTDFWFYPCSTHLSECVVAFITHWNSMCDELVMIAWTRGWSLCGQPVINIRKWNNYRCLFADYCNTATALSEDCTSGVRDVDMEDTYNTCRVGTLRTPLAQLVVVMNVSLWHDY